MFATSPFVLPARGAIPKGSSRVMLILTCIKVKSSVSGFPRSGISGLRTQSSAPSTGHEWNEINNPRPDPFGLQPPCSRTIQTNPG